jgi:uncharacterized protein with FMN-binding domain
MWKKLQKVILSLSMIALFALYALQRQALPQGGATLAAIMPPTVVATAVIPSATATIVVAPTTAAALARVEPTTPPLPPTETAAPPTATASGAYLDGTYDGSQADANWGTVEVQVVITNGQISDVQFLQFPNHRNRSQEINSQAMPILTQEAIQAQQAQVDVVTGATDTSGAFIESLSAALSQAAR